MSDDEKDSALAVASLKGDLKALEERMNTHQATYETALERMESNAAKRETRQLVYVIGALALAVAFLSLTLKPDPPTPVQPAPIVIHAPSAQAPVTEPAPTVPDLPAPGASPQPGG